MISKDEIKKWLIENGHVPEGCENNEYWTYWYKTIFELSKNLTIPLVGVSLELKEKKLLLLLLAKDIHNLSNVVEDNELLEEYKADYHKLSQKIGEA